MAKMKSLTYALAGLGLSTTLFLGCQDILSQNAGNGGGTVADPTAQELSLRVVIRDSGACQETKHRMVMPNSTGPIMGLGDSAFADSAFADSAFTSHCVLQVRGADTGKFVPPDLVPDEKTRCRWVRTQVEVGRDEMTLKFHHFCPDDCKATIAKDAQGHEISCGEPRRDTLPVKPPLHDTDTIRPPVRDSMPICDSLRIELLKSVPGTPEHKDQEADFRYHCTEPKADTDTVLVKPPVHDSMPICDSLRIELLKSVPGTALHQEQEATFRYHCTEPIHDTVVVKPPTCDTLPVKPPEVIPPKPIITPVPIQINCDELRAKLAMTDSTSTDYTHLLGSLREHCPVVASPK